MNSAEVMKNHEYGPIGTIIYNMMQNSWKEDLKILMNEMDHPALELGVGSGRVIRELWGNGFDVDGVDISLSMTNCIKVRSGNIATMDFTKELPDKIYKTIYSTRNTLPICTDKHNLGDLFLLVQSHLGVGGKFIFDVDYIDWRSRDILEERVDAIEFKDAETQLCVSYTTTHCRSDMKSKWIANGCVSDTLTGSIANFLIESVTAIFDPGDIINISSEAGFKLIKWIDNYGKPGCVDRYSRIWVFEKKS